VKKKRRHSGHISTRKRRQIHRTTQGQKSGVGGGRDREGVMWPKKKGARKIEITN